MTKSDPALRSYARIESQDLARLLALAKAERQQFFEKRPKYARYANRIIATALCQGAALHYICPDAGVGINDFDIYTFYEADPELKWCYRRPVQHVDFGDQKFGQSQYNPGNFKGRRVDLMGRALPKKLESNLDPRQVIREWLSAGETKTARELAKKAVVLLEPETQFGERVWPQGPEEALPDYCAQAKTRN